MKTVILLTAMAALALAAPQKTPSLGKAYVPPGVSAPGPSFTPQGTASVVATAPVNSGKTAAKPASPSDPEANLFVRVGNAKVVKIVDAPATGLAPALRLRENPLQYPLLQQVAPEFGVYDAPITGGPDFSPQAPATVVSTSLTDAFGDEKSDSISNATVTGVVTLAHHYEPHDPLADDTGYSHGYVLNNGQHHEESAVLVKKSAETGNQSYVYEKDVRGSYSYVGPDNKVYSVTYKANKDGFQPMGKHIHPSNVVGN